MKFYTTSKISENIRETPEGYLVCLGVSIARTGEMIYGAGETPIDPGPDGKVVISRTAEELFRPETIASFEGKAITVLHPVNFLSPENWASLAKGIFQNVRRGKGEQENDLVADLLVTEGSAIQLIRGGLREVSCGYEADYIETGIGRGIQKNIVGNHLALVPEGRAGSSYAINDHKGKGQKMKLSDKIKAIFAKAQDEALRVATEDSANTETPEKKDGFVTMADMKGYFDEKFSALGGKQEDASTKPTESQPAEVVAKDEEPSGLEARLAKVEAMLSKLMAGTGDADGDDDEETADESCEDDDDDEVTDEDEEVSGATGDSAGGEEDEDEDELLARCEILSPGMAMKGKNAKAKALGAAYQTKDGKAAIHQFTHGKAPNLKDVKTVDALFIGVSELLKMTRANEFSKTKTRDFQSQMGQPKGAMTPEEMNAKNAKHYGGNQTQH